MNSERIAVTVVVAVAGTVLMALWTWWYFKACEAQRASGPYESVSFVAPESPTSVTDIV